MQIRAFQLTKPLGPTRGATRRPVSSIMIKKASLLRTSVIIIDTYTRPESPRCSSGSAFNRAGSPRSAAHSQVSCAPRRLRALARRGDRAPARLCSRLRSCAESRSGGPRPAERPCPGSLKARESGLEGALGEAFRATDRASSGARAAIVGRMAARPPGRCLRVGSIRRQHRRAAASTAQDATLCPRSPPPAA